MNKYQQGKIYKIVSDVTDDVYIGSTTEPTLARRLANHRGGYKRYLAGKSKYPLTSYKILERGASSIVLLESFPCDSKDQLRARERHYIETTPNCVNINIPSRTAQEYYKTKGEHYNEYRKDYYKRNQDTVKMQQKKYRDTYRMQVKNRAKRLIRKVHKTIDRGNAIIAKYLEFI